MSDVLIDQGTMEDIGDAIREKLGVSDTYLPASMPAAIRSISGGGDTLVIQDASIYSEDEQQVGVWTDGKPLYQKTIDCGLVINDTNEHNIAHNISNIEKCISCDGVLIKNNEEHFINAYRPTQTMGILVWRKDANIGYRNNWLGNNEFRLYVTLLYTKTTDTAGSGGYKAYGLSPIIYSEEEREVGVWTDGKPLYQKTVDCGLIPNDTSWHQIAHNISDLENAVYMTGIIVKTDGTEEIPVNSYRPAETKGFVITRNGSNIQFVNNWNVANVYRLYVTIQYTKTTDTPGSGIWTTTGEYAHHYSTTEHAVGTWFGETLYERSYDLTLPSAFDASGGFLIDNDVSYIKMLVSAEGSGKSPEGYITNMGGLAGAQVWQYNVHRNPSNQLVLYSGQSSSAIAGGKVAVTIRYTKTT